MSRLAYTPARCYRVKYEMMVIVEAEVLADDEDDAFDEVEHLIEGATNEIESGGVVRVISVRTRPEDGNYEQL